MSDPLTDALKRAVAGMQMNVMALDDILATKLLALDEHSADYRDLLQIGRSLREQIDWEELRRRVDSNPFARAFFTLADGLGIAVRERQAAGSRGA
jgi:hypothetical protein